MQRSRAATPLPPRRPRRDDSPWTWTRDDAATVEPGAFFTSLTMVAADRCPACGVENVGAVRCPHRQPLTYLNLSDIPRERPPGDLQIIALRAPRTIPGDGTQEQMRRWVVYWVPKHVKVRHDF